MRLSVREAEPHVHDVLNVFMCTGFERATHRYFMKASPVRPGDFIEFFAEIDLIGALSACPGGDCGATPFERRGALPSAQGRDLPPARRGAARLAAARGQRLFAASEAAPRARAYPKRSRDRSRAFRASISRSRGGAALWSEKMSLRAASATSSTARSNASALACDGLAKPLTLRTNWSAEARISSSRRGRFEIEQRTDVAAHGGTSSSWVRSQATEGVHCVSSNRAVTVTVSLSSPASIGVGAAALWA